MTLTFLIPSFLLLSFRYLIQDGGNVKIAEIDGPIVRLELEVRTCLVWVDCACFSSQTIAFAN